MERWMQYSPNNHEEQLAKLQEEHGRLKDAHSALAMSADAMGSEQRASLSTLKQEHSRFTEEHAALKLERAALGSAGGADRPHGQGQGGVVHGR